MPTAPTSRPPVSPASASRSSCSFTTSRAPSCPTACSRSGRPTATAATTIPTTAATWPLDAGFEGYGRASTFTDGSSRFTTIKPGRVPWPEGGLQASHINVSIFARGVLNRLATRLYFDGDPALSDDPVLKLVEPARRDTLIAKRDAAGAWRLPIHLGGPRETVFFDV